jgi:hypothetical protein
MTVSHSFKLVGGLLFVGLASAVVAYGATESTAAEAVEVRSTMSIAVTQTQCTAERLGTSIPVSAIG